MAAIAAPPERVTIIRPNQGVSHRLGELWAYRELLYFLVWRDLKVRYKQTALGVAWAVIQPVVMVVLFTIVFTKLATVASNGEPYAVFVLSGLVVWNYFSSAVGSGGGALVANANLITKVYFPRVLAPVAALLVPFVDLLISLGVLAAVMGWYGVAPSSRAPLVVPFLLLAFVVALSTSLWLSALNVRYRDVRYALPFLVQVWLYATPVIYPASSVHGRWSWLLGVNPVSSAVTGFRWALLGTPAPKAGLLLASCIGTLVLAVGGFAYFSRVERRFADII
jgi:lipopolysaccharide transport system permease protein